VGFVGIVCHICWTVVFDADVFLGLDTITNIILID
jgi:hypothetical protein